MVATRQTVNWDLSDGAGNPRNGILITITPTRSDGTIGALFLTVDDTDISAPLVLTTSGNGEVASLLWGNADTKDPASWYAIEERGPDYVRAYKIQVPTSGGPFNASDIEADPLQTTSGAVPLSLFDGKGELIVGTGPDTADNLPADSDGKVLTLDSSTSTGVKWAAAGGGGAAHAASHAPGGTDTVDADYTSAAELTTHTGLPDAHHNKSHVHTGDGSGTVAHTSLSTVGADDHHPKAHDHSGAEGQIVTAGIPDAAVTYAKIQDVSATNRLLGRKTAGSGDVEEITLASALVLTLGALGLTTAGHGATEHADITDSVWCSASNMPGNNTDGSSLTGGGTLPDRLAFFTLADAATQGAYFNFKMPKRCKAASTLTAVITWTPASTDATPHTVRWSADTLAMVAGTGHGAAGSTVTWTGDSAARTATQEVIETGVQVLASVNPGDLIRFDLRRVGADGADTYVGVVNLVGVDFEFTSIQ